MARNSDGHYEVDESYITGNEQVKCDAEFTSRIYDKVTMIMISAFSMQLAFMTNKIIIGSFLTE